MRSWLLVCLGFTLLVPNMAMSKISKKSQAAVIEFAMMRYNMARDSKQDLIHLLSFRQKPSEIKKISKFVQRLKVKPPKAIVQGNKIIFRSKQMQTEMEIIDLDKARFKIAGKEYDFSWGEDFSDRLKKLSPHYVSLHPLYWFVATANAEVGRGSATFMYLFSLDALEESYAFYSSAGWSPPSKFESLLNLKNDPSKEGETRDLLKQTNFSKLKAWRSKSYEEVFNLIEKHYCPIKEVSSSANNVTVVLDKDKIATSINKATNFSPGSANAKQINARAKLYKDDPNASSGKLQACILLSRTIIGQRYMREVLEDLYDDGEATVKKSSLGSESDDLEDVLEEARDLEKNYLQQINQLEEELDSIPTTPKNLDRQISENESNQDALGCQYKPNFSRCGVLNQRKKRLLEAKAKARQDKDSGLEELNEQKREAILNKIKDIKEYGLNSTQQNIARLERLYYGYEKLDKCLKESEEQLRYSSLIDGDKCLIEGDYSTVAKPNGNL